MVGGCTALKEPSAFVKSPPFQVAAYKRALSCRVAPQPGIDEDQSMTTLYLRPTRRVALSVEPRLASWDAAGSAGQVGLSKFLDHAEAVARR